tara:strand:+ start:63 stop:410 length:348 start_codon:yes stop_codon:yes gene_type:complete
MKDLKNEAKKEVARPILNPLGWIIILSLIATVSFPFVWVWGSLWMATKISLTGFMLMVLLGMVYKFIEKQIGYAVDKEFKENPPSNIELYKSRFREKLDKAVSAQKGATNNLTKH